ncbi:DinB superfamily protein [Chitinophaga sp. YR573]|uniref:DinB family protein n=1 Tax=Chitinophaga sp. YR573 TaxID=1881040 RepID=UPI0008AFC2B5|nr:DinB family protein [Chitinophaga sp. YR573]SEW16779.1 DinB superfamily protein [Chitinophaga sp. YR573]
MELFVKMALQAWDVQIKRTEKLISSLSDEQLLQEVAPGRNRGIYLLGHLIAVHDAMLPLFGLGEKLYSELEEPFIKNPDNAGFTMPAIKDLRERWTTIHNKLSEAFNAMTAEQWLQRHNAMTDEDLQREPHRNKLSVLMNRTSHVAYHLGQLIFIRRD